MDWRDSVARIEREHAANLARVEDFKTKVEQLRPALSDEADFEKLERADEEIAALGRKLVLAEGVAANSAERLAAAKAGAAEKAKADERAAVDKEAKKLAALVREIAGDSSKLKAKIGRLEEHRERAKAAGVEDAETRVRRKPARTVPAITQATTSWFDPAGNRYGSEYTTDNEGRQVLAKDRVQREIVDVIREEYELPGEMPEPFADAIRLVDLEGRAL